MPTKRIPKTETIYVIQGSYGAGYGWEDVSAYPLSDRKGAYSDLREYRASNTGAHRIIKRRVDRVTQEPARRSAAPRKNPSVACSPSRKKDRYRKATVMHEGEWVKLGGCYELHGQRAYKGHGKGRKVRIVPKKVVRQKASRSPSRVKGVRARKRS